MATGATAIAYETVTDAQGGLPLLAPMSEVAGRMAVQVGAHCLEKAAGGAASCSAACRACAPARVVIIGGGVVGSNAARIAIGMRAHVTVLDRQPARAGPRSTSSSTAGCDTLFATRDAIERAVLDADLVIGAVLLPGAAAPRLVSRETVARMRPGSVHGRCRDRPGRLLRDLAARPRTPTRPIVVDGVVHYCVTNMPGAVARTSTFALNNATLPFTLQIADKGWQRAAAENPHLAAGVNVHAGAITDAAVAHDLGLPYRPVAEVLA